MNTAIQKQISLKLVAFFSMLFVFNSIFSQSILTGKILDEKSGEDLIGATVKIKGTSSGGVTDINGEFKITTKELPPLTLEISYVGYTSKEIIVKSFSEKIKVATQSRLSNDFMIISRIESLILGQGMDDALRRADAYVNAGSDGIMIHSRKKSAAEISSFLFLGFRQSDVP